MEVSQNTYESVLGRELPDSIDEFIYVDRQGYAPDVADVLGTNYLPYDAMIFSPEQGSQELHTGEDNIIDSLLDEVYGSEDTVAAVTSEGPLAMDFDFHYTGDTYVFRADPVETGGWQRAMETYDSIGEGFEQLQGLDTETLKDTEHVSDLVRWSKMNGHYYDLLETIQPPTNLGMVMSDEFNYTADDVNGTLSGDRITIDGTRFHMDLIDANLLVHEGAPLKGRITDQAFIKTQYSSVNLVLNPLQGASENRVGTASGHSTAFNFLTEGVSFVQRYLNEDNDDTELLGALYTGEKDTTISVIGSVEVRSPWNRHSLETYGVPPADPEYRFYVEAPETTGTVYYLNPEHLSLPRNQTQDADDHSKQDSGSRGNWLPLWPQPHT